MAKPFNMNFCVVDNLSDPLISSILFGLRLKHIVENLYFVI